LTIRKAVELTRVIKSIYDSPETVPLHEPRFDGAETQYLLECIDSTYVSSVGKFVSDFEQELQVTTGAKFVIATVNGTAALHVALLVAGVEAGGEVITQPFNFVASCNSISYCGANPVFVDICPDTLGMCPDSLRSWLSKNATHKGGKTVNRGTGKHIAAIMPMHTFGHPARMSEILEVANSYGISVVEDAAEGMGSRKDSVHVGNDGLVSATSFNGNKIITTGGGGAIITNNETAASRARHLTTTARVANGYRFEHDEMGFNYRMPNLNASLGLAQLGKLDLFVSAKRDLARLYKEMLDDIGVQFSIESNGCESNYWLNSVIFDSTSERDEVLDHTNKALIATRPPWTLMSSLPMFEKCQKSPIPVSIDIQGRLLNIPSSVPLSGTS
jgi:perosamine synthetase